MVEQRPSRLEKAGGPAWETPEQPRRGGEGRGERLVFLTQDSEVAEDPVDAILVWDRRTASAQVRDQLPWVDDLGPATRDTVLVHTGWSSILVPLEGSAGPTVFPELPWWGFTLLDPRYLYNIETGRFFRLKPPLQPTALPPKLVDTGRHYPGDYHAIRLP